MSISEGMMNRVIRILCFSVVCMFSFSWAMVDNQVMQDKIAVIVNKHVITEGDVEKFVSIYAKLSDNEQHVRDPEFRAYITSLMVVHYMLVDFATRNQIMLTPEEEIRTITAFMEDQDLTFGDFKEYAEHMGVEPDRLQQVICAGTLQQKVGMAVIAPDLEVTEDELIHERHQYIDDHALYKMKTWTVDLDSGETIESVKAIKRRWAETNEDPSVGEVHDLGWKKRAELPDLFLRAIEGVSPGNLVGPVQSAFGYHLIWFEGEKMPQMPGDSELREKVLQQKYAIKFADWLRSLQQYNIVIYK